MRSLDPVTYQTKPKPVTAVRWHPGADIAGVIEVLADSRGEREPSGTFGLRTGESLLYLRPGDWIVTPRDGGAQRVLSQAEFERDFEAVAGKPCGCDPFGECREHYLARGGR